jgi:hypothetical protein
MDQKLFIFSIVSDLRTWVGDATPLTFEEWKKTWMP